jgi:hypothetical protein
MTWERSTSGNCSGYAIMDAINDTHNAGITEQDVQDLYKRRDWTDRGGRLDHIILALKFGDESLGGWKVKDYKIVFFDGSPDNPALEVRKAMNHPHTQLLMSMWLRKRNPGQRWLKLDDNFYLEPRLGDPKVTTHGLYVKAYDFMEEKHVPLGVQIQNNWGNDWGLGGDFFMTFPQMQTEVCQLFEVEFEKI